VRKQLFGQVPEGIVDEENMSWSQCGSWLWNLVSITKLVNLNKSSTVVDLGDFFLHSF
jgi:hypothetical protein